MRLDLAGAAAARHQQNVQRRMVVQGAVGKHPHALAGPDRSGPFGDEHREVGVRAQLGRGGEDLPGSGEVELFDDVEEQ
ncbi:hypothetical protein GCM10010412_050290 [Nonomuraea recticatena]|uniref:Uncharacterized protein n=1 Tax=Nonomuraea recticatena TaxID=46178 RepID=A0ABN3S952_9ACTN